LAGLLSWFLFAWISSKPGVLRERVGIISLIVYVLLGFVSVGVTFILFCIFLSDNLKKDINPFKRKEK
jgi:hypothetical protein